MSGNAAFVKKGFEIAYAVFRIAESLESRPSLREQLEAAALAELDSASQGDYERLRQTISLLSYFLRLGSEAGIIPLNHVEIVLTELNSFNSAIAEYITSKSLPNSEDIRQIFSPLPHSPKSNNPAKPQPKAATNLSGNSERLAASEQRRSAIINKIRQFGNCRLKDILDALPGTSERTVRYDLQDLITAGTLERLGGGGPGTYYRLKNTGENPAIPPSVALLVP